MKNVLVVSIMFQAFVELHRGFQLKRQTVVTCIATLKKNHVDDSSVSCLVLGTEASTVYILDPEAFTILESMGLPAPPSHVSVSGLYDVEFRQGLLELSSYKSCRFE